MIALNAYDAIAFAVGALGRGRRRVNSSESEPTPDPYDPGAGLSVHGDMRTIMAESEKSIHASAASVISTTAGRLYGFIVLRAGSGTPTLTVHDNASAASGTVLKSCGASELVNGAWIYCGAGGVTAANGLHLTLGGTVKPIVLAVFIGAYPAISHSGTLQHIDGTDGDDAWDGTTEAFVSGTTGPKKTWSTSYATGNWHIKLKRGTIVDVPNSSMTHAGDDFLIEDYGDAEAAKPVLRQSASKTSAFSFLAASGIIEVRNVSALSLLAARKSGPGWNIPAGARAVLTNCDAEHFVDGFSIGGNYAVLDGCTCTDVTNGLIDGNNTHPAPNYSLCMGCDATAEADVYSLHNGTGTGIGNACVTSTLTVGPSSGTNENAVDVNTQFAYTLIGFNTINGSTANVSAKAIGSDNDADTCAIIANLINCGRAGGLQIRAPNWTATGNVLLANLATAFGGACLVFDQGQDPDHGASNAKVYGNYCLMGAASTKPMLFWSGASDGEMKNNLFVSVNATQRIIDMGSGAIAGWGAGKWETNDYWAPGITNTTTFASVIGGGGAQRLSTFSASYADGSELNVNPSLDASYRPPADSALIGAGTNLGVCYMGFDGPFWQAGPPTVGATELQR